MLSLAIAGAAIVPTPALANYPKQTVELTGPSIGGVRPEGRAECDNIKHTLRVQVKNVNLPDGAVLTVNHGRQQPGGGRNVETMTLLRREAQVLVSDLAFSSLIISCGASDNLAVTAGGTIILSASERWKT